MPDLRGSRTFALPPCRVVIGAAKESGTEFGKDRQEEALPSPAAALTAAAATVRGRTSHANLLSS